MTSDTVNGRHFKVHVPRLCFLRCMANILTHKRTITCSFSTIFAFSNYITLYFIHIWAAHIYNIILYAACLAGRVNECEFTSVVVDKGLSSPSSASYTFRIEGCVSISIGGGSHHRLCRQPGQLCCTIKRKRGQKNHCLYSFLSRQRPLWACCTMYK